MSWTHLGIGLGAENVSKLSTINNEEPISPSHLQDLLFSLQKPKKY